MAKNFVQANFQKGNQNINVGLVLILWESNSIHYQYAPELDLTGYGSSAADAKLSFEETLDEFITYTVNKKTLFSELERLGWTTNKTKKKVKAPEEQELLNVNETFRTLLDTPGIHRSTTNVELSF